MLSPPHNFSLHVLPLIVLKINNLEIDRRHVHILDILTSKWKHLKLNKERGAKL